jgi:predicted methyltransferase
MKRIQYYSPIWLVLTLACLMAPVTPLCAREAGARPEINQPYTNPDYDAWVGRFERSGREVFDKRHEIVAAMGLEPGMAVADIGAGTGLFTRLFATVVGPTGKVYAVDVSRVFIQNVLRTGREQGLKNIEGIVNTQTDVLLRPASIDLAFICDTYHHFEHPKSTLRSIHRALRPGASLIVIDYQKIAGISSPWVMEHIRAPKEAVIHEVEAAGFRLIEENKLLQDNYFLRFRKS